MRYRSPVLGLAACLALLSACDGKHPLHSRMEVEIKDPLSSHCEVITTIEQTRIRIADAKSLLRSWKIRTPSGQCWLLLSWALDEPPAAGTALGLWQLDQRRWRDFRDEHGTPIVDCRPVGARPLPACPADLPPLP
jgi:hypothetical protein